MDMREPVSSRFTENDIRLLIEAVDPSLLSRADAIMGDSAFIESLLDAGCAGVFQRIMLMDEDAVISGVSPRFFFDVLLRTARREMEGRAYTVERTTSQKIPVFDAPRVVRFLENREVMDYLADMLASFIRIESFSMPVRVRKGVWRRVRFNDMDLDSLQRFCQTVDEERRFGYYKRMGDLCLFIMGMFPEYAFPGYGASGVRPGMFGRHRRTAAEYVGFGPIVPTKR